MKYLLNKIKLFLIISSFFATSAFSAAGDPLSSLVDGAVNSASSGIKTKSCSGKFPNLVNDVCWSCAFPFTVAGIKIKFGIGTSDDQLDSASTTASSPGCSCMPAIIAGATTNQFQPETLVETHLTPGCMPVLNGATMDVVPGDGEVIANTTASPVTDFNIVGAKGSRSKNAQSLSRESIVHVNLWKMPIMYILDVAASQSCTDKGSMDVAFVTFLNAPSNNPKLANLINLDAILFANPIALLGQGLKAVAGTLNFGDPASEATRRNIYWCTGAAGCQMPLTVHDNHSIGVINSSINAVGKSYAIAHRQFIRFGTSGEKALCKPYPKIIYDDNDYKITMTYPIPQTKKILGRCCQPMSSINDLWSPGKGLLDEQIYIMFQKRSCCLGYAAGG